MIQRPLILECLIYVTMLATAILLPLGATLTVRGARAGAYVGNAAVSVWMVGTTAALLMLCGILMRLPGYP
jgi:hypothetical protein